MGSEWGPESLEAFFRLLFELTTIDPETRLSLEEGVCPDIAAHFQQCWQYWLAE
ncbi:hypothetical protein [Acaryochloris thomasi]|nr:hypothetical protein [Acaryochloris thomasi]